MSSIKSLWPSDKVLKILEKRFSNTFDLATFFPRKYLNMTKSNTLLDFKDGDLCVVDVKIADKYGAQMYPEAWGKDKNNDTLVIRWYGNSTYYFNLMQIGKTYRIAGRLSVKCGKYDMANPTLYFEVGSGEEGIYPVYTKFKGISQETLIRYINKAISTEEAHYIPSQKDVIASSIGLWDFFPSVEEIHKPTSGVAYKSAMRRIAFETIYDFYYDLKHQHTRKDVNPDLKITTQTMVDDFINNLPFELTSGQQEAVDYILQKSKTMDRIDTLITGDVGCGKTMVALIAALLMWENGYQTAIMAPTTVLAKQHYEEMTSRIPEVWKKKPKFALLTSKTTARSRKKILEELEAGKIDILIGTSSVLNAELEFHQLAMTIVDEEHKFGSEQKKILENKGQNGLHHIAMTATPIPRSLSRTVYGEGFDILSIKTMPKGRKPIITKQSTDLKKTFECLADEVKKGHQAYVVCPFIEDSESDKFKDVMSATTIFEEIKQYYKNPHPGIVVDMINGQMATSTILSKLRDFEKGKTHVLVSTTIVEVGVNVPNATAIMIASAERFGLAALHQLRGRVGRAGDQGYCYLVTQKYEEKLDIICRSNDGFLIAEEDMKIRGPGNIVGEAQTGYSKAIDLILSRPKLSARIRSAIDEFEEANA